MIDSGIMMGEIVGGWDNEWGWVVWSPLMLYGVGCCSFAVTVITLFFVYIV